MRRKKRLIRKIICISFLIIILSIIGIFIGKKLYEIHQINKYNKIMQEKINEIFRFEDLNSEHNRIIQKYGAGTDNINSENKIFCTTYASNFDKYNVIRIFYYNDLMQVEKVEIYNYNNSKYEILNFLTQYLGECVEYNTEIKDLATEYKWKYENYEIILIDNIETNSIFITSIN